MSIYGRRVPNASETPYTPTNKADWADPDPTNVAGALDALAAAGGGGLSNVVDDTTPQLGGDLDVNGQAIVSVANGDVTLAPDGTGDVIVSEADLRIYAQSLPMLYIQEDDPAPATGTFGTMEWVANNSASAPTTFARISAQADAITAASERGAIVFRVMDSGTLSAVSYVVPSGLYMGTGKHIQFEGATSDGFQTTLTVTDPTADRTITLPDASGTIMLNGIDGYPNFARSFHFDGSTRLSITDAAWSGSDYTTAYTIEAFVWLQPDAAGDNVIAGQLQPGVGGNQSWLWRIDATAGVTELLVSNGTALTTYTFNIMPTPGSWTHMAVNYNGSTTATLYMNGVQVAQAVSGAIAPSSSTDPVVIGGRSDGTQTFKGQMFYVRFWSVARTATAIANNASAVLSDLTGLDAVYLFNSDVTDSSGNGNTLTVTGTATYPVVMPPMTGG